MSRSLRDGEVQRQLRVEDSGPPETEDETQGRLLRGTSFHHGVRLLSRPTVATVSPPRLRSAGVGRSVTTGARDRPATSSLNVSPCPPHLTNEVETHSVSGPGAVLLSSAGPPYVARRLENRSQETFGTGPRRYSRWGARRERQVGRETGRHEDRGPPGGSPPNLEPTPKPNVIPRTITFTSSYPRGESRPERGTSTGDGVGVIPTEGK